MLAKLKIDHNIHFFFLSSFLLWNKYSYIAIIIHVLYALISSLLSLKVRGTYYILELDPIFFGHAHHHTQDDMTENKAYIFDSRFVLPQKGVPSSLSSSSFLMQYF